MSNQNFEEWTMPGGICKDGFQNDICIKEDSDQTVELIIVNGVGSYIFSELTITDLNNLSIFINETVRKLEDKWNG